MKVEILDYEKFLIKTFPKNEKLVKEIITKINTSFVCQECKEVLEADAFHNSKTFDNRRGKYPICKVCVKAMRKDGRR